MRHTDWEQLEEPVRLAIEARTGRVHAARTADAGLNSQLAVVLDTEAGTVFVKGLRVDHPGVVRGPSSTSAASGTRTIVLARRTCRESSTPCTGFPRSAALTCR